MDAPVAPTTPVPPAGPNNQAATEPVFSPENPLPPAGSSLEDWQSYVWQMNIDRNFNLEDASKKLVMLMEEMGELAKAVRKTAGMKFTDTTRQTDLAEELADVQIVLLGLASVVKIDMATAVMTKERKNQLRSWK